jgi:hypothetical protein
VTLAAARRTAGAALATVALLASWAPGSSAQPAPLPERLSDREFWALSQALSEPEGFFPSDNLVSNESSFQAVIPALVDQAGRGGVYVGVGPEQNFTYIAALQPRLAFVVDIRAGNRQLHLMYKALFELAETRAEFIALLFSRPQPPGLPPAASVADLFRTFAAVEPSEADFGKNLRAIRDHLVKKRWLPLSEDELAGIEYVYRQFFKFGPGITYSSTRFFRVGTGTTYALLMRSTDPEGVPRSFLATETNFQVMKQLHEANLVVPVVGNFAGPTSLRSLGEWLRARGAAVSAFYLSNVEDYLSRDGVWLDFCRNVAAMPLTARTTFIRSGRGYQQVDDVTARGRRSLGSTSQFQRMAQPSLRNLPVVRLGLASEDLAPCTAP